MSARWKTTKALGIACGVCQRIGTCTVSPDGIAFKCWRHGGNVHQMNNGKGNGTGFTGGPHQTKRAGQRKCFATIEAAIAASTPKGATVAGSWSYIDGRDEEIMRVVRFDLGDDKAFLPFHNHKGGWRLGDPAGKLPLYRLDELLAHQAAAAAERSPLYLCEGEKAADATRGLGLIVTTSAHGSSSAERTDWTSLANQDVVILPDNDEPGAKYAQEVARILVKLDPPARVKIVKLPGLPEGGDVVEFIAARPGTLHGEIRAEIEVLANGERWIEPSTLIGGPVITCLADVEPQDIEWLWKNRIPLKRITLLVGKPGEGKSYLTMDWAARVTRGTPWPDGVPCPSGSVILISDEDSLADTIRPRLDKHSADVSRVHHVSAVRRVEKDGKQYEVMFTLDDVRSLETALKQHPDCKLVVVDPIGSFIGAGVDAHRDNAVRAALAPVAALAEKYGAAVVVVAHRRKSSGDSADELALGSRAFTGLARVVWHVSGDKDKPSRRLLLSGKNNLAREGAGLAFSLVGTPIAKVEWEREPVTMSADEALAMERNDGDNRPGPEPVKHAAATQWLQERLADGPVPVGDPSKPEPGTIRGDVAAAGISWATIRRASDGLSVVKRPCPTTGKYQWSLPQLLAQACSKFENLSDLSNQTNSGTNAPVFDFLQADCADSRNVSNQNSGGRERTLL